MSILRNKLNYLVIFLFFFVLRVSAHGDEPTAHVSTDTLSILMVIFSSLSASLFPLIIGYLTYFAIKKQQVLREDKFLVPLGFSFGILLFLLFDYASLSSIFVFQLNRIIFQSIKVLLVIAILIFLSYLCGGDESKTTHTLFLIWGLGIFIHTLGEGIIMGYNLTQGIAVAFELFSITSYMMHKFVEGIIGAVLYAQIGTEDNEMLYKTAIIAGLSILPGALLGYFAAILEIDSILNTLNILVFALGFAITAFVLPSLIPEKGDIHKENYFLAVSMGLMYMYLGVILHNI